MIHSSDATNVMDWAVDSGSSFSHVQDPDSVPPLWNYVGTGPEPTEEYDENSVYYRKYLMDKPSIKKLWYIPT